MKETSRIHKCALISYIPLFYPSELFKGNLATAKECADIIRSAETHHRGCSVSTCVWTHDNEYGYSPILVMDNARDVYNHIIAWSDNEIGKRFQVHITLNKVGYTLLLVPDREATIARWKLSRMMAGEPVPQVEFEVYSIPLYFSSDNDGIIREIWDKLPGDVVVGFMHTDDLENVLTTKKIDDNKVLHIDKVKLMKFDKSSN